MMSKKSVLGIFNGSLKPYTIYSRVADEKQKKKGLRCFLGNLVELAMAFLFSLKGAICKKVWETLV